MKKVIKKNYKFIFGAIIGLVWSSGIAYAATIYYASENVSYDNTSSGLESTTVQDALDELYANSDAYLAGLNAAHPVGSYLETSDSSFDPNVSIGGTWSKTSEGNIYETRKILWTNSNPNNAMNSQSVTITGLSTYNEIEIFYKAAHVYSSVLNVKGSYEAGKYLDMMLVGGSSGEYSGSLNGYARSATMNENKITFGNAVDALGGSFNINNNLCIPLKVFGIKYNTGVVWHRTA